MKLALILLLYLIVGAVDVIPLLGSGHRAEAVAAGVVTGLGALYAAGVAANLPLPNPVALIDTLFHPIAAALGTP